MKRQSKLCMYLLLVTILLATVMVGIPGLASAQAPTLAPLSSLAAGSTVIFAGCPWVVLNPATGYLVKRNSLGTQSFDSKGNNVFNPNNTANIGYYLNNTFYNSLPAADRSLILYYNWTTGNETNESSSSVNCYIGLLSYSEYNTYSSYVTGPNFLTSYCWTRTPFGTSTSVTWVSQFGTGYYVNEFPANSTASVYPTLHLSPGLIVSETNANWVIGGTYYNVSVLSNYDSSTMVSGSGAYAPGDPVTAMAVTGTLKIDVSTMTWTFISSGYNFMGWIDESGALVSNSTNYTFTMGAASTTLVGNFQPAPVITVMNGAPFSVTVYNTNGALAGTYSGQYGSITSVADGNNNVITGTLQGLPTTGLTSIYYNLSGGAAVTLDFQAVNPPTTTLDNTKSFY